MYGHCAAAFQPIGPKVRRLTGKVFGMPDYESSPAAGQHFWMFIGYAAVINVSASQGTPSPGKGGGGLRGEGGA